MTGWNIRLARELCEKLRGVTDRNKAVSIIREWWQRPENKTPRDDARTAEEAGREIMAFAASFDEHLPHVIEKAATSRGARDGLNDYAQSIAKKELEVSPAIQRALFANSYPNTKGRSKGQSPGDYAAEMQRAAIIGALRSETPFNKLTTDNTSLFNAYDLAHEALERYGVTFDKFRKAYSRHRDIFGGEKCR